MGTVFPTYGAIAMQELDNYPLVGRIRPILIYPEGTLMRPGKKMRYRAGAWHIYHELGIPAVPVAKSLSLAWPRRDWRKFPARCAIEFLEPIPPGLGKQEFMQLLEDRAASRPATSRNASGQMRPRCRGR